MRRCCFGTRGSRLAVILLFAGLAAGCATTARKRGALPSGDPELAAVHAAAAFICASQVTEAEARRHPGRRLAGGWPQWLALKTSPGRPTLRFRDPNGFTPAVIHESLGMIHEEYAEALALTPDDVAQARAARTAAMHLIDRFRRPADSHAAGACGYWLPPLPRGPLRRKFAHAIESHLDPGRPRHRGTLAPLYPRIVPPDDFVWPDGDTTAVAFRALKVDREKDGGTRPAPNLELFSQWRDQPGTLRYAPSFEVLARGSGVFLTWFDRPGEAESPNEVDLVVNANILHTLGKYNRLDLPGAVESTAWIVDAVRKGLHHDPRAVTAHYQHAYLLHAAVAGAYRSGGVSGLRPAVEILARDIRREAVRHPDGTVFWEGQSRVLATAAAASTLLDAGYRGPLLDGAIAFFVRNQKPDGSWRAGWVAMGDAAGMRWKVKSEAGCTAFIMDLLCRYVLAGGRRAPVST